MKKNIDDFLVFEYENNLFDKKVKNFNFWIYIRQNIYNDILSTQNNNIGEAHSSLKKTSFLKRISLKIKQLPNWIFHNPVYGLKQKDILILNHARRVKDNGLYEDIYIDPWINHLNKSYEVFEAPMLDKHYKPVPTNNLRYFDYINTLGGIKAYLRGLNTKNQLDRKEKNIIKSLIALINEKFSAKVSYRKYIKLFEVHYNRKYVYSKYYSKILDRIKPKIIIEVVSYNFNRYLINELAHQRNIPVVELQHGTMGKYHAAYNYYTQNTISNLPDYIFTFGDYWKDNTRLPLPKSKIISVGWPFYEEKLKIHTERNINSSKKTILFISQGTIGKELSKFAIRLSELLDLKIYRIIFKLHPGEYDRWKDIYPWLIDTEISVIDNNDKDMHYYFNQSDVQIGVNSTAIFEGLGYNLKTYIVKLFGYQYMEDLYNSKSVTLVNNPQEIIKTLEKNPALNIINNYEYFWERNSLQKMIKEIEKIIEKSNTNNSNTFEL